MLFLGLAIVLHHVFDVGSFIIAKNGLVFIRTIMDNRINGTLEHLAGSMEHIGKNCQDLLT